MLILGISCLETELEGDPDRIISGAHDAAAVLLSDGRVVAAGEEERFTRVKHSSAFPARSITHCLGRAARELVDVRLIGVGWGAGTLERMAVQHFIQGAAFRNAAEHVSAAFERVFGVEVSGKIRCYDHHMCHAWSAAATSGFHDSLVVTLDAAGEGLAGSVSVKRGEEVTRIKELRAGDQSLGYFYWNVCRLLGYGEFDAYKVMGLAPYGDPERYGDFFRQCCSLGDDGEFTIRSRAEVFALAEARRLARGARQRGDAVRQDDKDLAAGLQRCLESIVLHLVGHFAKTTGLRDLCLAGGVAHNCSMNGQLLYSGLFNRIYVQPVSHDAGIGLGAAFIAAREACMAPAGRPMPTVFLGPDLPHDIEIESELRRWQATGIIECTRVCNVCGETARMIADGSVVAWVQGRSEFGPRALGNRSILADPRPAANKDRINAMVKKREGFRPLAPAVQVDRTFEFFEAPADNDFSFMTFVVRVRDKWRNVLGAVTHVDGTARIQTVAKDGNPRFWQLLDEFDKITGLPILLNTSFNNNAEPIVDTVADAVTCFLTTGIDCLIIGDWVVRKSTAGNLAPPGLLQLCVEVPEHRMIRRRVVRDGRGIAASILELSSTPRRFDVRPPDLRISRRTFDVLSRADTGRPVAAVLAEYAGSSDEDAPPFLQELFSLWQARALVLRPTSSGTQPGS